MDNLLPSRLPVPLLYTDEGFTRMELCTEHLGPTQPSKISPFQQGHAHYIHGESWRGALPAEGVDASRGECLPCTDDQYMEIWTGSHY